LAAASNLEVCTLFWIPSCWANTGNQPIISNNNHKSYKMLTSWWGSFVIDVGLV